MTNHTVVEEIVGWRKCPHTGLMHVISNVIIRARDSAIPWIITSTLMAEIHIRHDVVIQFVTIFHIHTSALDVVHDIAPDVGAVGAVDDDPALLRIRNRIPFEQTRWAIVCMVKMQTILAGETSLTAFGHV